MASSNDSLLLASNTTNSTNSSSSSLSSAHPIVYVSIEETIADVAVQAKASVGLSTSISVLMSILVCVSFFLNSALFATVLSSFKLRKSLLYLMFCLLSLLNLFDVLLIMLLSLLCVANGGRWIFGSALCRVNAFAQQFVLLANLLILTMMGVERAFGLIGRHLVTIRFFGTLLLLSTVIPVCFASSLFLPGFPVALFPFRYVCAIDSGSPILYSIAQMLVYGGCFFVLLLSFGSILKHKRVERMLPVKPQDYGAFIMESRALEEHMIGTKAVFLLTLVFLLIEGPYICLDFFVQVRNSFEMLNRLDTQEAEVPQEADTLITLIKLFHPLFVPLIIFANCGEIYSKFADLMCFRRNPGQMANSAWSQPVGANHDQPHPNVLTLYATPEGGLQLRLPSNVIPHPSMAAIQPAGMATTILRGSLSEGESEEEEDGEEEEAEEEGEGASSSHSQGGRTTVVAGQSQWTRPKGTKRRRRTGAGRKKVKQAWT